MKAMMILATALRLMAERPLAALRALALPAMLSLALLVGVAPVAMGSTLALVALRLVTLVLWGWAAYRWFRVVLPVNGAAEGSGGAMARRLAVIVALMAVASVPAVLKISLIIMYEIEVPDSLIGFAAVSSLAVLYSYLGTVFLRLGASLPALAVGRPLGLGDALDIVSRASLCLFIVLMALVAAGGCVGVIALALGGTAGLIVGGLGALGLSFALMAVLAALYQLFVVGDGVAQDPAAPTMQAG